MLRSLFLQKTSRIFAENRLLKFCVVVLTFGFLWDRYELRQLRQNATTVVTPPVLNSRIEITGNKPSESYVREYVRYIIPLATCWLPATARPQFSEFLASWHPDVVEDARSRFYLLADQIEKTKALSAFNLVKITHDANRKLIEVEGNRRLTQQDQLTENKTKSYVISYVIENGRFWITSFKEKDEKNNSGVNDAKL